METSNSVGRIRSKLLLELLQASDVESLRLLGAPGTGYAPLLYLTGREPQPPHRYTEEQVLGALRGVAERQPSFFSFDPSRLTVVQEMRSRYLVWIAGSALETALREPGGIHGPVEHWIRIVVQRAGADGEEDAAPRRWLEQNVAHGDARARLLVMQALTPETISAIRPAVEARLLDDDMPVAVTAASKLYRDVVAPAAESVQKLLQNRHGNVRSFAIQGVAAKLGAKVEQLVLPALRDTDAEVRAAAAAFFADTVTKEAVPDLVALLRDPNDEVRKQSADALQRIRFFHEQQAHWERIARGLDASTANATEKLLLQAKPGEPKEQRLLAVRSLGALGAAEALPFLIDWSRDADADVARAAAGAIAQIHQRAGVPAVK